MTLKLLTEHRLEILSLKGGCTGSSESTLVKMPHCWKSHDAAQITITMLNSDISSFENSPDPDHLVSEKTIDQDPHCFPLNN